MTFRTSFEAYRKLFVQNSSEALYRFTNAFRTFLLETAIRHNHTYSVGDPILSVVLEQVNRRESKSILVNRPRHDLSGFPPMEVEMQEGHFVWLDSEDEISDEDVHYWHLLLLNCLNYSTLQVDAFLNEEYERAAQKSNFLKMARIALKEECVRQALSMGMIECIEEWLGERDRSQKAFSKRNKPGKKTQIKDGWMKGVVLFMRVLENTQKHGFCYDCTQKELAEALAILSGASVTTLEQEYSKYRNGRSGLVYRKDDFQKVRTLLDAMQRMLNDQETANQSRSV